MINFTGIQPSGDLTLGNYIGSIKNFKKNNKKEDTSYFCIVDQHALTIPKDAKTQKENIDKLVALYIAMDLHKEANVFIQSHVPAHTQLAWVLMCHGKMGELERMTQYKDKSSKNVSTSVGLFTYPVLMAADILLYDSEVVPVGQDQKQHVELTRDLAEKMNSFYKEELFVLPTPVISKTSAKIYSLTDPTAKMSKSDENPKSYISLLDDEKVIMKKLKSATTDSLGEINYDPENQPGVSNLLTIYKELKEISMDETVAFFKGKGYGDLKVGVAEVIIEEFKPIQARYYELRENTSEIEKALENGAETANLQANKKINEVYKVIGL